MESIAIDLPISQLVLRGMATESGKSGDIIALHGWLDNCHSFVPMLSRYPHWPVMAIDLVGHGHSDHLPVQAQMHFADYVNWLEEVRLSLKRERLTLLGHSMGAGIASLYAGCFPERVDKLILVEGLGPLSGPDNEVPERLRRQCQARQRYAGQQNPRYKDFAQAVRMRQQAGGLSWEAAELLAERGMGRDAEGFFWSYDPRLKLPSSLMFSQQHALAFLSRIACPSVLILGKSSKMNQNAWFQERIHSVPNLQVHQLAHGHHHLHMDSSADVGAWVDDFLRH
jgi:pimeloyl-ACP methyl ester carboxylesterase